MAHVMIVIMHNGVAVHTGLVDYGECLLMHLRRRKQFERDLFSYDGIVISTVDTPNTLRMSASAPNVLTLIKRK